MNLWRRFQFLRRAWRHRLYCDKFGISFLRSRELQGTCALDIGANRGIYSYWLHRMVGANGTVIAFEPQPELVRQLNQLKAEFQLTRLEVAGMGLSSAVREKQLVRPPHHWGGAGFDVEPRPGMDVLTVPVTTLDHYLENRTLPAIRFIKLDVEGHECEVLRGGRRLLDRERPDLLIECHTPTDPHCAVFSLLRDFGYEGFCFVGRGYQPVARYNELKSAIHRNAAVDFAFVPTERAAALSRTASADRLRKAA